MSSPADSEKVPSQELCEPPDVEGPGTSVIGLRLRSARERAGLLQDDVFQRLGYPPRSLTRWENGRNTPNFDKIIGLADLYGVSTDWIAGRTDIRECARPGMVLVDWAAIETLEELAAAGGAFTDVPSHLVRRPGIKYATEVPERPLFLSLEEAKEVDLRVRELWKHLGGQMP